MCGHRAYLLRQIIYATCSHLLGSENTEINHTIAHSLDEAAAIKCKKLNPDSRDLILYFRIFINRSLSLTIAPSVLLSLSISSFTSGVYPFFASLKPFMRDRFIFNRSFLYDFSIFKLSLENFFKRSLGVFFLLLFFFFFFVDLIEDVEFFDSGVD